MIFNTTLFNNGLFNQLDESGLEPIAYTGSAGYIVELQLGDWTLFGYSGEEASLDLLTFKIITLNPAETGETTSTELVISHLLDSQGYSGESSILDLLYIPPRAELDPQGYSGELAIGSLAPSYALDSNGYSGELAISTLDLTDYGDYILTEGPSAYWKFDEVSGTQAVDSTGNNSPATISGAGLGVNSPVASKKAFYFDGGTDTVSGQPYISSSNITQELWVKPDAGATIELFTPNGSGTQGASGQRWAVWPNHGGVGSGGGISVGSNGIQVVAHGNSYLPILLSYQQPVSTTQYTHILVSWNDRVPTLYVNGVAVGTGLQARAPFVSQGLPASVTYGAYKGHMQDVAIYPSALTADQAREHYLAGIGLHYIPRFEPLQGYSGEYADADLTDDKSPLGITQFYSGEYTQLFLENNIRFYADGYSGEHAYINHDVIDIVPNSTFTHFYGISTYSTTSTCLTLNSVTSSLPTAGINAYFALPQQLVNDRDTVFRFKRTRASSWYDDDFTDAGLWFCLFPNYTPAQITFSSWSWGYAVPNYWAHLGALIIRLRLGSTAIRINWINSSGTEITNDLTVNSSWTATELNGTDECSFVVRGSSSNTIIQARGKNDVVRQTGTFSNLANPFTNGRSETTDTFLIHYHNYTPVSEVLCGMHFGTNEGFVIVPFSLLGITSATSGENSLVDNLITTSSLDSAGYSGEVNEFVFTAHPAIDLGTLSGLSGEITDAILLTSVVLSPIGYSGELGQSTLSTFPSVELSLLAYSGERGDSALATSSLVDGRAYTGEYSDSALTVFYSTTLVIQHYSGESGDSTLSTQSALEPRSYSDQYSTASLTDYPAIPLSPIAYSGEAVEASVQLGITFPSVASDGGYGVFDLEYIVNLGMLLVASDGGYGETTLATTTALPLIGYSGSVGSLDMGAAYALDAVAYSGEYSSAVLTENLADQLASIGYNGQYVSPFTLSTRTNLPSIAYSGELVALGLTILEGAPLLLLGYGGQLAQASMQTSLALPMGGMYNGQWANVVGMATEPNIYSMSGETAQATLWTSVAVSSSSSGGERLNVEFTTAPPPRFDFVIASGESTYLNFNIVRTANFRVIYRTSVMTQVDMGSATYFDLTTDECCGERAESNNLLFVIEKGMLPEEVGFGDRTFMTFDLSCAPRMRVEFSTGERMSLVDTVDYLEVHFETPLQSFGINWEADMRHRLCKGYFIPTGDWIATELTDILPEDCYTDRIYSGESMHCELSDSFSIYPQPGADGTALSFTFSTNPPMVFNAYAGERMWWDTFDLRSAYKGERMTVSFYEPPIPIYAGSFAEFNIETENYVRFLEEGCLENEFRFQTKDGDEIPELFNPVPVEGEPYQHDIRGECF